MHGVEAFPRLRNQASQHLVEHDRYRSIAIETDCLAAVTVDAFVAGEKPGYLDEVMRSGFSHGFEKAEANRELVAWMREYNRSRDAGDRLRFYGFDAPMEMTHADSPRPALTALRTYLATSLEATLLPATAGGIDSLAGADERWSNPAAILVPTESVGASDEATKLRLLADDLVALLIAESPRLIASTSRDEWWRAWLHGRTAAGLLRYHAAMADTCDSRIGRLPGLRDVMMADNINAILTREGRRGPTLMLATICTCRRAGANGTWESCPWSGGALARSSARSWATSTPLRPPLSVSRHTRGSTPPRPTRSREPLPVSRSAATYSRQKASPRRYVASPRIWSYGPTRRRTTGTSRWTLAT